jgi:hypothetical protein
MPAEQRTKSTTDPIDDRRGTSHDGICETLPALARDRSFIKGIYDTCDQWCMYCPVTERCLAFRLTAAQAQGGVWDSHGTDSSRVAEATQLLKILADAEGRLAPPEIEAVVSGDRERQRQVFSLDDPLERIGRRYVVLADAYLRSRADFPPAIAWHPSGPSPLEVLTWYHVLAPARIFRAILCAAEARAGLATRHTDARAAAKIALIGIDRSLAAVDRIQTSDDDPRLQLLRGHLLQLGEAVEARFPDARTFVRPGLDETAAGRSFRQVWLGRWRHLSVSRALGRLLHWRHERQPEPASGDVRGSARRSGSPRG